METVDRKASEDERRQRRAQARPRVSDALSEASFRRPHPARKRARGDWESARFAESKEDLNHQHRNCVPGQCRDPGEDAPPRDHRGQCAARAEAVAQPAAGHLKQRVGDAETERDPAHHHQRNSKFIANRGTSHGQNLAVHVGDHVRRHGQAEDDMAHARRALADRPARFSSALR